MKMNGHPRALILITIFIFQFWTPRSVKSISYSDHTHKYFILIVQAVYTFV